MPRVSIVIPNYNKGAFLIDSLSSVQANTFQDWEIILIDDGSTDNSLEIAQQLANTDKRIRIYTQTNSGGSVARNKGIDLATGEFLLFLDSDDLISQTCLEKRLQIAKKNNDGIGWVFPLTPFDGTFNDKNFLPAWIPPKDGLLEKLVQHDINWQSMSPLWRTSFIKEFGHWNSQYPRLQDIQFHTHLLLQNCKIYTFPDLEADCYYRLDERKLVLGNRYNYLEKWVQGCGLYQQEFIPKLPDSLKRKITKTSMSCMEVMGHYLRKRQITSAQFVVLSKALIGHNPYPVQRVIFHIYSKLLQHLPFHVPGLAKLFKICLR